MIAIAVLLSGMGCSDVDGPKDTDQADSSDSAGDFVCGSDPFVSVEVGYGGLCGIHQDGCVECAVSGSDNPTFTSVPARELTGLSLSDGCYWAGGDECSRAIGACGLRTGGAATCWGYEYGEFADADPGLTLLVLSVGYRHACGLDGSGAISCWGECLSDVCASPSEAAVKVVSGHDFSCALLADGSVECWGYDSAAFGPHAEDWPAPLENWALGPFDDITAVPEAPCGRSSLGAVTCFSYRYEEVYSDAYSVDPSAPNWVVVPNILSNSPTGACALTAAGAVTCSGDIESIPVEKLAPYTFTQVAASGDRLCGVTPEGEIVCAVINENWAYCPFCTEIFPD